LPAKQSSIFLKRVLPSCAGSYIMKPLNISY
jgi:hypothetical protein